MLNTIVPAVLLGAAAVSAKPLAYGPTNNWGHPGSYPTSTQSASSAGQTPFKFPLDNGFPNLSNQALRNVEEAAHGTLPNGALSTTLNSTTVFQLIAFNELFEVAFFTDLIYNITHHVPGYSIQSQVLYNYVVETLTAVQAQEELHALGANGILKTAGKNTIDPSEYVFPVDNFDDAIHLAQTFTDVVLGTLQDGQAALAANGDDEYIPLLGAVQGQEGEQNGYYRSLQNLIPSAAPFLTRSAAPFAFSALNQNFVVPGTSHGAGNDELFKSLPIFGVLNVESKNIKLENQEIEFSVTTNSTDSDFAEYNVVFINQQNVPVVSPIKNLQKNGDVATFSAYYAAADLIADALTIAAVAKGSSFPDVPSVAAATLFGPGLIEIN
jgi:hypothetical protein